MALFLRILFIAGFCLATVGAAGFTSPREPEALPFLIAGLVVVAFTGLMQKRVRRQADAAGGSGLSRAQLAAAVAEVLEGTRRLEAEAGRLENAALGARLESLAGRCAEIGSVNEDYIRLLGLKEYTLIWDGFASGERLLNRAWSMSMDGFPADARLELPRARAHFEKSAAAALATPAKS